MFQSSTITTKTFCDNIQKSKLEIKSISNWIILIIILTLFICIIPPVQAADSFATLKNQYIQNHPGQSIIPYPWETSTSTRVLPFNYEIPAGPANDISITASGNQFEAASFIITAQKDLSGININVPNLYNAQGNSIPADAINVRTVKVWYQAAADDIWLDHNEYILAPELLLKDDSLVKVDYVTKTNYLKVTINGVEQYIDISSPTTTVPSNAQIHDAVLLQSFSLKANENKQIWMTVHVPSNTPAGDYSGNITITSPSEPSVVMDFSVTILPFDLAPSPIEYAMYYRGVIPTTPKEGINSEWKTPEQYAIELQNIKDHGILYPTVSSWYENKVATELSIRNQIGFPNDHIYLLNIGPGNPTDQTNLTKIKNEVLAWKKITSQYGYQDTYFYGMDEANDTVLQSERPAWQAVHSAGAKVFVATGYGNTEAVNIVGDLLDLAVIAGPVNPTQAAQWHSNGKRVFSYANPQVGIEDPKIYRQNYGFALSNAGYDGAMDYAYQHGFGPNIWNDYDSISTHYRDHVFAYPTSNGVIDTIQWEGFSAGVDDTRYVATLTKQDGSDSSAKTIVSSSLSSGDNPATIRGKLITQILTHYPQTLTPTVVDKKLPTPKLMPSASPTVTNLTPASGNTAGSSPTLVGTNFREGATVKLQKAGQSDIIASNVVISSPTKITCTISIPATAAAGSWDVVVTNSDGTSGKKTAGFSVTAPASPTVTSITPASGNTAGSSTTLVGTNFRQGATVKLQKAGQSDIIASNVAVSGPTKITCTFAIPATAATGSWDVVVMNSDGTSGKKTAGFSVTAPVSPKVTSSTSASTTAGTNVSITRIAGNNSIKGAASPTVTSFTAPVSPTVTGISPRTGKTRTNVSITSLAGTNFKKGATVKLQKAGQSDIIASNVAVSSPTKITCTFAIPATAATGSWDVVVMNSDGTSGKMAAGFITI